ncbi:MAG: hypothetical protein RLZZ387_1794 [Chloroflexota bacterium]|jgi:hypothetical protein
MLGSAHRVRAGSLVTAVVLWSALLAPPAAAAPPPQVAPSQREAVAISRDGALRLAADSSPAPTAYGDYTRFGTLTSPPLPLPAFRALRVTYGADVPAGSAALVDVRASADGTRWTPWATEVAADTEVEFASYARFAQYRVTLLGGESPVVRGVSVTPAPRPAQFAALEDAPPVAPTFTVRATRQGMVGGRTANGYRIQKRDRFVSLPCRCVLSSNGGGEYMVRITYNGRSAVAPVYDVGPWNVRDNYWDPQEQRHFSDLRQGWPQDHAAFFEKHNGGRAHKGRVRFPTAIDVGDGVWWDELGIKGDRAEVEVTFLWMGRDPLEVQAEQAAPPAPEPTPEAAPPAPEAVPPAPPAPAP